MHKEQSEYAGQSVTLKGAAAHIGGQTIVIEDWWDRVAGKSWMDCTGNPACLDYAVRSAGSTPIDNEVLYGKIGSFGKLVHISEIAPAAASATAA